ncbi:hypothetical protein AXG93_3040s1020 [Marchantia polymorpha subsp. ruderalis]|uniref:Uncharacterized protein n=1 Tax=Marchantia polymorpha subsp. ruderalis TaxID=1480154 RepID=A0A176W1C8_MARPO|nr:hypothetical protein AXG93_3040s1020 [Marchantia polymorpha subsp. ruderalis]
MAAAVRRAVQHQGSQLQALQWPTAIRAGAIPLDVVNMDSRLRLPVPSTAVLHDWAALQDRRLLVPQQAWNYGAVRGFYMRNISQLVTASNSKRAFLVDTLALVVTCFVFEVSRLESLNLLVRRLESQGLTPKQAEAITAVITEVLNDSLENVAQTFTSKSEMQRSEMMMEGAMSKFKAEVQSSQVYDPSVEYPEPLSPLVLVMSHSFDRPQEHHIASLQRETERLRTDIDKLRSELRYEVDKVTAGHRLDLNLERGRIRDELATQSAETSNLTNKLDREIHTLKTQLEAAKYDIIKYCIGTIVSVTAVGLGLLRIIM